MTVKQKLTFQQCHNWLYYETGFEQLHPDISIIEWMEEQGYTYQKDWKCVTDHRRIRMAKGNYYVNYWLEFPNENIATLFNLKWIGVDCKL
jgi:hypothetical protein